ncbi:MAG TPA: caspase family protein [Actinoplanes sp.]|nr:caspase family protein [Actinoplanes sp.]
MRNLYALLVGIDRYAGPDVPNLGGCVNDIDDVLALLKRRVAPDAALHPLVLRDEQASRDAVAGGLRSHLRQAGPRDSALFWFSGHGSQAPMPAWADWFEEPTDMLQTLVCADSRSGNVPDLLDKELSVLLDLIAERAGHLAVVLDSCHSESANREAGTWVRAVDPGPVPGPASLVPELTARALTPGAVAGRDHVALFACRRTEAAEERLLDGNRHGLFTWSLLQAMNRLGTAASYRDLLIAARAEVIRERGHRQVPQLYPGGSDLVHQPFLGGVVSRPDAAVVMSYGASAWEINVGSAHGLPVGTPGIRVGEPGRRPVPEAEVVRVLTERSLVVPAGDWQPQKELQYRVVLTGVPMPRTTVAVAGAETTAGLLMSALRTAGPAGGASPHVRTTGPGEAADLAVTARPGLIRITDATGEQLGSDLPDVASAVGALEHLARWRQIRDLRNPLTGLRNTVRIEIVPAAPGVSRAPETAGAMPRDADDAYRLSYRRGPAGWEAPEIFIRLHNTGSEELYCVLLDLTGRFGVHAALFAGAPVGPGRRAAALRGRRIRVSLPDGAAPEPGRSVTDWLVLVAAEKQFSAEPFLLPPLGEPVQAAVRGPGFPGLLERLGERAVHRDLGAAADAGAAYDWTTETVRVITRVPAPHTSTTF